ncbi:orotidine-5'-phosphate decarboxylase [Aquifex aeolicus]|uniref:Orotidine 5'-phosphate decarboxylase n=1 Tax=Aquifex aeolicus (strain VF5) TaxID=224324 RepID=PYRF_AQUAE|nr:orotidine-5'-phosphate decarboxylase [Aquifex aeolicus]O67520.1 RecName: Full=Orotidine 5'-phosphate decarboxylase; AltName: Full=OMP decarboxylase; Short=OMPDCase; Short=OMPdecase [Aquifex aeolicus VF5]AAC07482.1 orotidine-5'-phosphate decarboxylase [Aquifex aeolicus VF5]
MARICVALDVPWERAIKIVKDLYDFFETYPLILKIGHKIYLEKGGDAVKELKEDFPYEVFLDLKLHDIPSVVGLAVEKISELGTDYTTVHLLGGPEMVKEAVKNKGSMKILGVTILTSHDENYIKFLKSNFEDIKNFTLYLARVGIENGVDGVVCSGEEVEFLKKNIEKDFIAVVPGIRIKKEKRHDQKRVLTPAEAKKRGADVIVIGREITESKNPVYVVERALKMMGEI